MVKSTEPNIDVWTESGVTNQTTGQQNVSLLCLLKIYPTLRPKPDRREQLPDMATIHSIDDQDLIERNKIRFMWFCLEMIKFSDDVFRMIFSY